jgi:hypothetical protein
LLVRISAWQTPIILLSGVNHFGSCLPRTEKASGLPAFYGPSIHNTIVNFIWSIADEVLRDVYLARQVPRRNSADNVIDDEGGYG